MSLMLTHDAERINSLVSGYAGESEFHSMPNDLIKTMVAYYNGIVYWVLSKDQLKQTKPLKIEINELMVTVNVSNDIIQVLFMNSTNDFHTFKTSINIVASKINKCIQHRDLITLEPAKKMICLRKVIRIHDNDDFIFSIYIDTLFIHKPNKLFTFKHPINNIIVYEWKFDDQSLNDFKQASLLTDTVLYSPLNFGIKDKFWLCLQCNPLVGSMHSTLKLKPLTLPIPIITHIIQIDAKLQIISSAKKFCKTIKLNEWNLENCVFKIKRHSIHLLTSLIFIVRIKNIKIISTSGYSEFNKRTIQQLMKEEEIPATLAIDALKRNFGNYNRAKSDIQSSDW